MGKNVFGVIFFCIKFLLLVIPLVLVWWLYALPWYGEFLKQVSGSILKFGMGMDIISGDLILEGLLNTESKLTFAIGAHEPAMPIVKLVSNIPPYIALVLATPALGLIKKIKLIGYGVALLSFCHVAFIVFALSIEEGQMDYSKIPTALAQFFITLPFLLWVIFAYWDRIMPINNNSPAQPKETAKDVKNT